MAQNVQIKWRVRGFKQLRSAPGVQADLEKRASGVAARANRMGRTDGYKTSSRQGAARPQGRWRTTVITANAKAMGDNMRNNTLIKALFGG